MQEKQFDNNNFVLYSPNSLNYITSDLENILEESLNRYKLLFNINEFRKVQINYFDNIDEFRNYIYKLRGEDKSLPEYAQGTFDNGMINAYIDPNIIENTPLFIHKKYNASHELFHIMYQELVWEKNNQNRIVWFDEGMAQYFSKENEYDMNDNFNNWFNKVLNNTKVIPNLNELSHGKCFKTNDYNGYNLSLLSIKYLYDRVGEEELIKIMHDNKKIEEYGKTIVNDAFNYYKK